MYQQLLDVLLNKSPDLNPSSIMVDFEQGAINAFKARFPDADMRECFFHLCQNVYKHVQSNGLQERYGQDADFALAVRMIPALAFVPVGDVPDYYEALENSLPEDVDPILSYLEKYYVGRLTANGQQRTPMFPIPLWNVHNDTILGQDRTNNAHEGWQRRFVSQVTCHHPTLWKFINCLKAEEKSTKQRCEQLLAGGQPPRRKKNVRCDRRLHRLPVVHTFEDRTPVEFLHGVAYNFFSIQCC